MTADPVRALERCALHVASSGSCHPERYSAKDLVSNVRYQILREYAALKMSPSNCHPEAYSPKDLASVLRPDSSRSTARLSSPKSAQNDSAALFHPSRVRRSRMGTQDDIAPQLTLHGR